MNDKIRMIKILDVSSLIQTCGGDSVDSVSPELTSHYFGRCDFFGDMVFMVLV
jgi:hypothetical protein